MAKEPKFRKDGQPDGRGHGEGSLASRFAVDDGRNRPGKSKGAKSLKTIYRAAGDSPVRGEVNGKAKRFSAKEAIVLKEREQALKGDHRARETFLKRVTEYSPIEVEPDRTNALLAEDEAILAWAFERGLIANLPPGAPDPQPDLSPASLNPSPEGEPS